MERRTKLLILIFATLALLVIGVWYLLLPIVKQLSPQPPSLPSAVAPSTQLPPMPQGGTSTPPIITEQQKESQTLRQLSNFAGIFIARLGSGTSVEGFQGYSDVMVNATPELQTKLRADQKAMQKDHPATGPRYNLVTRVVSTDSRDASVSVPTTQLKVQVQRAEDSGDVSKATVSYKDATVTLERQSDSKYLVSDLAWKDVQL